MRAQPITPEWFSVRLFRGLAFIYTKCSYILSIKAINIFFTCLSGLASQALAAFYLVAFFGYIFMGKKIDLYPVFIFAGIAALGQAFFIFSGLGFFLRGLQPEKALVVLFIISAFVETGLTVYYIIEISRGFESIFAPNPTLIYIIISLKVGNTVLDYYLIWIVLCIINATLFIIEGLFRVVFCCNIKPYNEDILLPFIFYPPFPTVSMNAVNNFETVLYSETEHGEAKECMLCLTPYVKGDQIIVLKCHKSHLFHIDCIKLWIVRSPTCPFCRKPVIEPNANPDPNPNPNQNANPNANANPNPAPAPAPAPNANANPAPALALAPNPNPNQNANVNPNANPNPAPNANVNPAPAPALAPAPAPNANANNNPQNHI